MTLGILNCLHNHGSMHQCYFTELNVRPDLLNVLLLEPGGSKIFLFSKKNMKFDHVIELIYMLTRLHTYGLFVAQRESCFRLHCTVQV